MAERHQQKRAAMAENIAATTGRTVEEWVDVVDEAGIEGFMGAVSWLKEAHGIGHFQARRIAEARRDR